MAQKLTATQRQIVKLINHRGMTLKHEKKSDKHKERYILSNDQGTVGMYVSPMTVENMREKGVLTKTTLNLTAGYKKKK